ncbi:MAG: DegT/DnrJ/EryC1/StrS family aminotransferase, partial [Candidatus Omnitrophica bacterium]|nr:DegT/DnrJ/EryC1/StrS family aminotransferase [Candidatus Omnitrophota bacterium]
MISHSRPTIDGNDRTAAESVLKSGYLAQGPKVEEFESKFAAFLGSKGAVAANSGTSALHLALLALGLKDGDEVIIPSFVCAAVLNAVKLAGLKARLADIDSIDFNLNADSIKGRLTPRVKAIVLPHLFGQPGDLEDILKLGIPVIEDCAQSLGSRYKGGLAGKFGTVSIFSFYATKMITTGHGGMLVSSSRTILDRARDLREFDERKDYILRFNYKMMDLEAALGISQFGRLESFIQIRNKIAELYTKRFFQMGIGVPEVKPDRDHIFYRYVIRVKGDINIIKKVFLSKGIEVKRPVFMPLHRYLGM